MTPDVFRRTLGHLVVEWIEQWCVHGPGDVQGQPVHLDDEQVRFLLNAYAIDEHGRRVIRRGVYSRAKGRAKSELAAFISWAEALGPVRFGGWDPNGFPIGRPVTAPFIKCVATEEGQAGNTYGAIEYIGLHGPLASWSGLDVGRTRTFLPGGGEIRAVSAKAASKDGGKESFVNFDETHLYANRELRSVHSTLRRNLAKRRDAEPWSLETTTMYAPGEDSIAEQAHVYAVKIRDGAVRDGGFLFDHLEGPQVPDFFDDQQILDSLHVAYGEASGWMDFDRLLADANEARESVDHKRMVADFLRYFLNQPTRAEQSVWIPPTVWATGDADVTRPVVRGVGVEVDLTGSLAAVAWAARDADGHVIVGAELWTTRRGVDAHHRLDGDVIPEDVIDDAVLELAGGTAGRLVVAHDARFWSGETIGDRGAQMESMSQKDLVVAAGRFHQVVHDGGLRHSTDPVVADMVTATQAVPTDAGWRVVKAKAQEWPVVSIALIRALHVLEAVREPHVFAGTWS